MEPKLKWNVFYYDIYSNKITTYNIFRHDGFNKYLKRELKECKTKEKFAEALRREIMYYFWSRAEWELIIELTEDNRIFLTPFIGCRKPEEAKIDVTNDTSLDWNGFARKHINKQIHKNEAKIDVHDQIVYTWDNFLEYVWNNKEKVGYTYE